MKMHASWFNSYTDFRCYLLFLASDPIKKIKLLNSTIHTITQAKLTTSTAMAHALILRADAFLEAGQAQNYKQALEDITKAISIDDLDGRAWRVLADVKEAQEDYLGAMEAISEWAVVNPEIRSKAQKELTRIMAKKAQSVRSTSSPLFNANVNAQQQQEQQVTRQRLPPHQQWHVQQYQQQDLQQQVPYQQQDYSQSQQ